MFSQPPFRFATNSILSTGLVLAVFGMGLTLPAYAEEGKDTVIATINGLGVTERELALAEVDLLQQFAETPQEQRRAAILNALIDIKALSYAAEEAGLDEEPNMKARLAFNRSKELHNSMFQEKVLNQIAEDEIKARYDIEIKNFPVEREIRARHILVEKEEDANAIIEELIGGADFAGLAKTKSTGPSGPKGGDLGYFAKGQMVPEFEKAAFALETGAFTKEPVKSQFGWHIIFKEDERDRPAPTFETVKEQIRQVLAREKYFALTQDARKKFPVKVLDEELAKKMEDFLQE